MREVNLSSLDLNLLVTLKALLDERHVTRAAERVGLSQPAMSRSLQRLRIMFKDPILVKGTGGMMLTARAEELKLPLQGILNEIIATDLSASIARGILAEIMMFRRVPAGASVCSSGCEKCAFPPLQKIQAAVKKNEPVTFILPAFPGKSPNPEKVLGPLPDHAERLSLNFLGALCQRIKSIYKPGIRIILCSDGRVFSDVVRMKESDVTDYQIEINRLIEEQSLSDISVFNLDHFYKALHFVQMREELMKSFGQSLDFLKEKIRNGANAFASSDEQEANRMYSGITRFPFENATHAGQSKSRSAVQKEARLNAYEVIRRSNAWSELLLEHFPDAVRLSIHPQTCGAKKLGIRLRKGAPTRTRRSDNFIR